MTNYWQVTTQFERETNQTVMKNSSIDNVKWFRNAAP